MAQKKLVAIRLLGLLILVGMIAYYIPRFNWGELKLAFSHANYTFVAVSLPALLLLWCMRSTYLWLLLKPLKKFSFWEVFRINQIGTMIDQVLPARSGYFYRWAVFSTKASTTKSYLASSLVASIALEGLSLIFLFFVFTILNQATDGTLSATSVLLLGLLFVVCLSFIVASDKLQELLERTPLGKVSLLRSVFEVSRTIKSPSVILFMTLATLLAWTAQVWIFIFLGKAVHLEISIYQSLIAMLVLNLAIIVPIIPGNVGTFQVAIVWTLSQMHFDQEQAFALSVIFHAIHALSVLITGALIWVAAPPLKNFRWRNVKEA